MNALIDVSGIDPCTAEPVKVLARLAVAIVQNGEAGGTSADVEVRLENLSGNELVESQPGTARPEAIDPLVRHFSVYTVPPSIAPYVHPLRTPLAGRYSSLDLAVDLQATIDDRGEASLSMVEPRIDDQRSPCNTSPASPQPSV